VIGGELTVTSPEGRSWAAGWLDGCVSVWMDLPGAADDDRQALRAEQLLAVGGRGLDGLANSPLHALEDGGRGRGLCGRLIDGTAIAIDGRQRYIAAL